MILKTTLEEFIDDIIGILDEAQIEWLETNKGYYLYKDKVRSNTSSTSPPGQSKFQQRLQEMIKKRDTENPNI